jgi:hypothetical protein
MFRLVSMEPSSGWAFIKVLYTIQLVKNKTTFGWVRDLVLENVHNTRSCTQQNTVNCTQYLFESSAWKWLHRNEPKHVAVIWCYLKFYLPIQHTLALRFEKRNMTVEKKNYFFEPKFITQSYRFLIAVTRCKMYGISISDWIHQVFFPGTIAGWPMRLRPSSGKSVAHCHVFCVPLAITT